MNNDNDDYIEICIAEPNRRPGYATASFYFANFGFVIFTSIDECNSLIRQI